MYLGYLFRVNSLKMKAHKMAYVDKNYLNLYLEI